MEFEQAYIHKCKMAGIEKPLSLDELWVKFRELYPKRTDYELISRIRIDMSQSGCDKFLQRQEVHTAFLMAYMYGKEKKCWDSRSGKWI